MAFSGGIEEELNNWLWQPKYDINPPSGLKIVQVNSAIWASRRVSFDDFKVKPMVKPMATLWIPIEIRRVEFVLQFSACRVRAAPSTIEWTARDTTNAIDLSAECD